MKLRLLMAACLAAALSVVGAGPATAQEAGAGNVEFQVGGNLQRFPCPEGGCTASVSGTGTGVGHAVETINGQRYDATFAIWNGGVNGSAVYSEPGPPFCPLVATAGNTATGVLTLSGGATGVIRNLDNPNQGGGVVTSATTYLKFSYERYGLTPAIRVTDGSYVEFNYWFPTTGYGSFRKNVITGAGGGVFELPGTTPTTLVDYCFGSPGTNVAYSLIGDMAVATN
jgi:hypothetical protein